MNGILVFSQNAITGYVAIVDKEEWEKSVFLSKIDYAEGVHANKEKIIAIASIKKEGYFSFDKKLISNKNEVYKVFVRRIKETLKDTVNNSHVFVLSNIDSIHFKKGYPLFSNNLNSNKIDLELQRLQKFKARLSKDNERNNDLSSEEYINRTKSFTKDSLEILWVKLLSIKHLEQKKLLDIDISKNPKYYTALLDELKHSDVNPVEYFFLEEKLSFLINEQIEEKYLLSRRINILLGVVIIGLFFFIIRTKRKKKQQLSFNLSKQERNIQELILKGKSNKEIASELFISLSTVKSHITNIYNKLGVSNRKELFSKIKISA